MLQTALKVAGLLLVSNTFMTFAWYGHLKYMHHRALWLVILVSWGIALIEYSFAVPANRLGSAELSGFQLKIIQEVVTLIVFVVFAWWVLGEKIRWNHGVAFLLLAGAAFFAFAFKDGEGAGAGKGTKSVAQAPTRVEGEGKAGG